MERKREGEGRGGDGLAALPGREPPLRRQSPVPGGPRVSAAGAVPGCRSPAPPAVRGALRGPFRQPPEPPRPAPRSQPPLAAGQCRLRPRASPGDPPAAAASRGKLPVTSPEQAVARRCKPWQGSASLEVLYRTDMAKMLPACERLERVSCGNQGFPVSSALTTELHIHSYKYHRNMLLKQSKPVEQKV